MRKKTDFVGIFPIRRRSARDLAPTRHGAGEGDVAEFIVDCQIFLLISCGGKTEDVPDARMPHRLRDEAGREVEDGEDVGWGGWVSKVGGG